MSNTKNNEVVFTMGLPAAGKSYTAKKLYADTHGIIDPDAVKEAHPDYDPQNPAALHAWSQEITEDMWREALASEGSDWLIDGTGTNAEKMVRRFYEAREAGFSVSLVYVKCSLPTSLVRNAARERVVPENIIRQKARDIATAFELIKPHADTITEIDNDKAF